jgi:oxygen-independent coproporphyrinogen-3 oxidase
MTHALLTPESFARYARANVPRYTSYPTAPAFSAAVSEDQYRQWLAAIAPGAEISLYLHVPFCRSMCLYCGCHTTVSARDEPIERYMDALDREIGLVTAATTRGLAVRHLHFGGGSPTLVHPHRMRALMERLRHEFVFASDAEIAIEVDPRTLSGEMAAALGASGFNRASIGVQSFDPVVQRAINRIQSVEETEAAVRSLREAGVDGINFDLIYGLPHQTVASCLDTVEQALRMEPGRFAVFGYAHVPQFKQHQRRIDAAALPDFAERLAQSQAVAEALTAAGYVEIGLDHFARADDPLAIAFKANTMHRNFQGYTTDAAEVLIGLGSSAIGRTPPGYAQNTVLISDYLARVNEGRLPTARGYALTAEDKVRGAVIERIMCDRKVDLAAVCGSHGWDPEGLVDRNRLGELIDDGLVEERGSVLEVTAPALPLVRSVAAAFDAYLNDNAGRYSRAV